MSIGQFFIYALFLLDIAVFGIYLMSAGNDKLRGAGRMGAWLMFAVSGIATVYLAYLFLNDQFSIEYVRAHSATTMQPIYKLTALWAGQDGTFLLWLFFLAGASVVLMYTMKEYESWTLLYMKAMEMILCVMLFYKNPFAPVEAGVNIAEGMGMNPLLMNLWMVSHPPIMFLGYAAAAAPFAIFLAGASMGETVQWVKRARGWTIGAWAILGIGIFLGMYWSYEVLGWGGYWAWDPVENASLFSWIILGGATHGMLLQPYRRSYALWNGVMVSLGYIMVLFSTFLTRSGVLADVSLHSFPGLELYYPLLFSMIVTSALGTGLIIREAMLLSRDKQQEKEKTGIRPLILTWAIYIFALFFIFVFIGTTHPLFESIMGKNPSPVQPKYFNITSFIPALPAALLVFLTPMIFARRKDLPFPVLPTAAGAAVAIAVAAGCMIAKITHPAHIALAAFSAAATVTSAIYFATHLAKRKKSCAGYMAHLGLALILLGIIPSTMGSQTVRAVLQPGETMKILSSRDNTSSEDADPLMEITLNGVERFELGNRAKILISRNSSKHDVSLDFIAQESQRMKINKPFILRSFKGDVYIAPVQMALEDAGHQHDGSVFILEKGVPGDIGDSIELTFTAFDLSKMQTGMVGIVLTAKHGDTETQLTLDYGSNEDGPVHGRAILDDTDVEIRVTGIDANSGKVRLEKIDTKAAAEPASAPAPPQPTAVFQVSTKPWIALIWLGMILLSIGSLIAMKRRF